MRIVIDLQGVQSPGSRVRGIGRYSMAFVDAIARGAGDHEVWIALNHAIPDVIDEIKDRLCPAIPERRIVAWESVPGTSGAFPAHAPARRVAERLRMRFLESLRADVVHTTSLFEGFLDDVVTSIPPRGDGALQSVSLYDLIPYVRRDAYLPDAQTRAWYLEKIQSLVRADLLLGISEYTCREAIEHLGFEPQRVANVSAGLGREFRVLAPEEREAARARLRGRFDLSDRFVVHTGGFDARKNLDGLVRAFAATPARARDGVQLVLVGHGPKPAIDPLREIARASGLGPRDVLFTDYVEDEDLVALYNLCALHVFPSFHEGFGLPALEAMACGAPVIGANATSLPEVIGLDEAMFDPHSVQDMAARIGRALVDDDLRARLKAHAASRVLKFSWEASAHSAIAAMERAHATRPLAQVPRPETSRDEATTALAADVCRSIPDDAAFASVGDAAARAIALNIAPARPQLLVDVTELAERDVGTGIQRVVRNIARSLMLRPHPRYDVRPVRFERGVGYLYANAFAARMADGDSVGEGEGEGVGEGEDDLPVDVYPGDVVLGLDLVAHVTPFERPYYQWLRRRGAALWFVVYDMLPIALPHYFVGDVRTLFSAWYESMAETATGLACISRAVADEVHAWYDETQPARGRPLPIAHFHLGADLDPGHVAAVPKARDGSGRTFLMVGTVEPRKAHAQVLDAFEWLWARGEEATLVIVGKAGWLVDDLAARLRDVASREPRLVWHEQADDALLSAAYADADALIMASEGEGFGLPLIEAAQHGLPLIARDLPVFREIAGEGAFYFQHSDPESLGRALLAWIETRDAGRHPLPDSVSWMTWDQSADQLLDAIEHPDRFQAWRPRSLKNSV